MDIGVSGIEGSGMFEFGLALGDENWSALSIAAARIS
jgi:hypothetical protein